MGTEFRAISYKWQDHTCYVGTISYGDVPDIIDSKLDLAMNRSINSKRVDDIAKYIKEEMEGTFFPPVILNCNATTTYDAKEYKLKIIDGQLTIIDGQHRLNSIKELINNLTGENLKKLRRIMLPVLIIEGLENYEHRELFYKINKQSKTVDNNISVRFTPSLENLLGLKYVSEYLDKKELIEWEKKQSFSKDKIAYIHLIECLKTIIKALQPFSNKYFPGVEEQLLYTEEKYYKIFETFLNEIFNHVNNTENKEHKEFFMTKVYLNAITLEICESLSVYFDNEENPNNVEELLGNLLDNLLKDFLISYQGVSSVNRITEDSIKNFIKANQILSKFTKESLGLTYVLVERYVNSFYNNKVFHIKNEELEKLREFVSQVLTHKDDLIKLNLEKVNLTKSTTIEELLTATEDRREQTVGQ
ncbi:MAG: hypothetical protein PME_23360 [Priestia megaterium]